jgi:flagellar hook-associated protein 3 FlgL
METLNNYYTQMSTTKKIQMPSDDPIVATRALKYRTTVSNTEQYISNTEQCESWLEITDSAFDNLESLLQRFNDIFVEGASETYTNDDRLDMLEEYTSLLVQFEDEFNTTYMGRYVFSGFKTDTALITQDTNGNNILNPLIYGEDGTQDLINGQNIQVEIGTNNFITVNSDGTKVYTKEMYDTLHSLDEYYTTLKSGKTVSESELSSKFNEMIDQTKSVLSKITSSHTQVGVKIDRVQLVKTRLEDDETNYTTLLSKNEDVDIAQVTMEYNNAKTVYTSALMVGSKIANLSLIDYM